MEASSSTYWVLSYSIAYWLFEDLLQILTLFIPIMAIMQYRLSYLLTLWFIIKQHGIHVVNFSNNHVSIHLWKKKLWHHLEYIIFSPLSSMYVAVTRARLAIGLPIGAPWIRSDSFLTRRLLVFSPRTKLIASMRFDLPDSTKYQVRKQYGDSIKDSDSKWRNPIPHTCRIIQNTCSVSG